MSESKRQQFFIIKAEDIPNEISIQSVKELIENALHTEQELINDPRENINFGKVKPISWRTMQKVFNIKTGPREEYNGQ